MYQDYNERDNPLEDLIIGRIVHYVTPMGVVKPAIVTVVHDKTGSGYVNLLWFGQDPFNIESIGEVWSVPYNKEPMANTWHWPRME